MGTAKTAPDNFDDDWGPESSAGFEEEAPAPPAQETDELDFLKPEDVIRLVGRSGRIEMTRARLPRANEAYSDTVLLVTVGEKKVPFKVGLKNYDKGYVALFNKFGKNLATWKGALKFKVMPHTNRQTGLTKQDGFIAYRPV